MSSARLKGRQISFYLPTFFSLRLYSNTREPDSQLEKLTSSHLSGVPFPSGRKKQSFIGSDCTSMHCGARDAKLPLAGWVVHPSALQHEAEGVCMRCSLLMTLSSFLMTLSSCSLSVPCNNESFESGNILGCVRQCKYKWKCASAFILTGTISCEGVYCWFLFLCILAVTLFLFCAAMVGLHGLSFLSSPILK